MPTLLRRSQHVLAASLFLITCLVPCDLLAQTHVVTSGDMQKEMVAAGQARQRNLETLTGFLTSDQAVKELRAAHLDPVQVKTSVSLLNDAELAQLAAHAQQAQADFAAGSLSDRDLLIILVGIAALILIIVAVH